MTDVGHGSGDSLLIQLYHPSVPRPARLTGITSLRAHYERSRERVEECRRAIGNTDREIEVQLYHGDAIYRDPAVGHPLETSSPLPPFTTILALDCAYHFRSRKDFLRQSLARLTPGGKIALADICFSDGGSSGSALKSLISLLGLMPAENIVTLEEYRGVMESIGYIEIEMEDISEDVFPGFCRFLSRRGLNWRVFSWVMKGFASAGARFVIVTGVKPTSSTGE